MLVQVNKDTGKVEFPIGTALLNTFSSSRRKARTENLKSDQNVIQDLFNNVMIPDNFLYKSESDREKVFKDTQSRMKTKEGQDTLSTLHAQAKNNDYDMSDKKKSYGKGIEEFNKTVEQSGNIAQSAAGGIADVFAKIGESGAAAKAGAFAANVGLGLLAGVLMDLAGKVLSYVGDKITKAATYDKDKIEKADKTRTTYQDKISDINSNISSLKGNQKEFESLSKGVDEYGNNISLDTSSYERFLSIRKEILDTAPSLISGYDAEGNAIARTSDLMDKAIDSQETKLKSAQKKYASDTTWDKLVEGNVESVKKASGTRLDSIHGKDMNSMASKLRDALQGDGSTPLAGSFNKAVRDKLGLKDTDKFDLYNQSDFSDFIAHYDDILNEVKSGLPSGSDLRQEVEKLRSMAKDYKADLDNVKKVSDQYNNDISTSMAGQISGYDKLSTRSQSFISGFAANTYNRDTVTADNLKDEKWVNDQRDKTIKMAKKFAKDKDVQDYLNGFVKTYDKSSGKSAQKWADDATKSYNKLAKTAKDDGINIEQMNKALEDSFDIEFKLDDNGKVESLLKDGKSVDDMISSIKEKLGDTKDVESFTGSLDLTEMSQAFDILNSKTETFTGSLDQLKERLKIMNQTKSQSTWSDYLQATETADSGATYLAMREAFNAQKKERDKGLIGTDDFKTLTSVMSSSGKTDAATFDKTWAKTTKYFTSDEKGLVKFLDDLSTKSKEANTNFGTLKKNADGSWSGKLTNTTSAAKSMGMGIEAFEAVLNRLKDYGGEIKFDSVVEQYKEAEGYVNQLADKWKEMKDGAGKTALGEQIEDYRQQILNLKNAGDDIPDEMVKKLKFEIEIADHVGDLKYFQEQYKINEKSMTTEEKNENLRQQVEDSNNILYSFTKGKEFGKAGYSKGVKIKASVQADLKDAQKEIDDLSKQFSKAEGDNKVKIGLELTTKQQDLIEQINSLLPEDKQIPIDVIDNATPVIERIDSTKIKDKKFATYVQDCASSVILAIKSYVNSLHDKSITITTTQRNIVENVIKDITNNGQPKASGKKNGKDSTIGIEQMAPGGRVSAHGTANAHGSFVPRSNAFTQGTVDDLTDWYDDELDDIEDFDAFACGTVKKLGSRALAMGTTNISDLSQIDPIVQSEKNKYIQEKKDKIKSSVGDTHANSGGDWGLKQDERALTGELGDELVV